MRGGLLGARIPGGADGTVESPGGTTSAAGCTGAVNCCTFVGEAGELSTGPDPTSDSIAAEEAGERGLRTEVLSF